MNSIYYGRGIKNNNIKKDENYFSSFFNKISSELILI